MRPFRKNITAQEIWEKDKRKIDVAKENNFEILIIWDSEFRKDKDIVIEIHKLYDMW